MDRRDLAAVWTVLESELPSSGIVAVGTGYSVVAGDIQAGIDAEGHRCILIPLMPGEAAKVDTKGRAVHLLRLKYAENHFLAVMCLSRDLYSVFTQFSRELLGSIESVASPAKAAAEAFDRWKALFSDATQRVLIPEGQLVGLIGELLTVQELLEISAPPDLLYWRGPFGEAQDFRTQSHALEVKATLVREGRIVSVSSIDQLEPRPHTSLFLVHHQLENDPGGFNIGDVTQRLVSLGASPLALAAALAEHRINLDNLGPYMGRRYRLVKTRTYDVAGVAFPRITRASFSGGDLPAGTLRVSYSIDLTNEPPVPLSTVETNHILQAIAKDASYGMDS